MSRVRALALCVAAALGAVASAAGPAAATVTARPHLRLFAATPTVELDKYGPGPIPLDLGVFLSSTGADFRLDVTRAGYTSPVQVAEVVGEWHRILPASVDNGWNGLARFLHYTVTTAAGTPVTIHGATLCPNDWNRQRVDGSGPLIPRFPPFCANNPFTLGAVWGIDRGWAIGLSSSAPFVRLAPGAYDIKVWIDPVYTALFSIPAADASVTVRANVVDLSGGARPHAAAHPRPAAATATPSSAPLDLQPAPATMPDLIPLPSWGISVSRQNRRDYLVFGATVWDAGQAPMLVEGYRRPGTNIMDAFQYFTRNGVVVGRAPAGTMVYDPRPGHQHWHFQQFASYSLLAANKTSIVRSQKEAFCLAPTDPINLAQRGAVWNPGLVGLYGQCGDATSIWTRETLPSGWGDTYFQYLPGQSFNITGLPNGTYYIQVEANPLGVIHEVSRSNDIQLRQVILGGTPGARTVTVPAWNGIDPETGAGPTL
jgi:hypothetical protein